MAFPENRRKAQRSVDEVVDAMPSFTKGTSRFSRSQVAPAGVPEAGDNTSMETLTEQMIADFEAAFRLFDEDGSGAHKSPPLGPSCSWQDARVKVPLASQLICASPRLRTGNISQSELKVVFQTLGHDPSVEDLASFMKEVDKDGNGSIDLHEFCQLMVTRLQKIDDPQLLTEAFRMFDKDGNGTISRDELKQTIHEVMMVTGETLPEDEFEEMLNEFDTDGDGTITFDEFRAIMSTDH